MKFYIPAVGLEIFSLACFWGAHGINLRRQAVLAGLYSAAEQTLIEYQKKVIEMVGKDQEAEIRNAISGDHSNNAPPITYIVDKEDPDCWFLYSGQWFRNSYSNIKDIQNDANSNMLHNLYISEAELIWLFDPDGRWIKPTPDSHHIGWNCDRLIEFDIVPTSTRKHEPAFEIIIRDKFGNRYLPQPGFSRSL